MWLRVFAIGAATVAPQGIDNTCNKRFSWQLGELPAGYEQKYTIAIWASTSSRWIQAAIGRVQLRRLPNFIEARKQNWESLRRGLSAHEDVLEFAYLPMPLLGIPSMASPGMSPAVALIALGLASRLW